jgi:hypothetical protein
MINVSNANIFILKLLAKQIRLYWFKDGWNSDGLINFSSLENKRIDIDFFLYMYVLNMFFSNKKEQNKPKNHLALLSL